MCMSEHRYRNGQLYRTLFESPLLSDPHLTKDVFERPQLSQGQKHSAIYGTLMKEEPHRPADEAGTKTLCGVS